MRFISYCLRHANTSCNVAFASTAGIVSSTSSTVTAKEVTISGCSKPKYFNAKDVSLLA